MVRPETCKKVGPHMVPSLPESTIRKPTQTSGPCADRHMTRCPCAGSETGHRSMLLWMSRPGEALLSGLSGGAEHAGYGGPGGVVLPGADHGGLQLFVGVDEVGACVSEQGDGVGLGVR